MIIAGRAILVIVCFFLIAGIIAVKYGESLCETLPLTVCGSILLLCILALFRQMSLIYVLFIVFFAWFVLRSILLLKKNRNGSREELLPGVPLPELYPCLVNPQVLCFLFSLCLAAILVSGREFHWGDDMAFWATETKSLYYLNGFAPPYTNTVPWTGSYPPGSLMFKWLFLSLSPDRYISGLQFSGYYCQIMIFLFPLLKRLRSRNIIIQLAGCLAVVLFPTLTSYHVAWTTAADVPMAVLYGMILLCVLEHREDDGRFHYARLSVLLAVLILMKQAQGIECAVGVLLFVLLFTNRTKKYLLMFAPAVAAQCGWMLFCGMTGRYFTTSYYASNVADGAAYGTTGIGHLLQWQFRPAYANSYLQAFLQKPLHVHVKSPVDLTPFLALVVILLAPVVLFAFHIISKQMMIRCELFFAFSALLFIGINIASHFTVFANEPQYLHPDAMILSIERYCAGYWAGGFYLLAGIIMSSDDVAGRIPHRSWVIVFLFVLLTADYSAVFQLFVRYRWQQPMEIRTMVTDHIEYDETALIEAVGMRADELAGKERVLYLRKNSAGISDRYVTYQASPVSVEIFEPLNGEQIMSGVKNSHATYLYISTSLEDWVPEFATAVRELTGQDAETGTLLCIVR